MGRASLRAARCVRGPVLCCAVKGLPTARSWWRMCCSAVERDRGSSLAAKSCRASDFQAAFAGGVGAQNPISSRMEGSAASLFEPCGTSLCVERPVLGKGPARHHRAARQHANLALSGAWRALPLPSGLWAACLGPPARVGRCGQPCARRRDPRARRRPGPTRGPRRRRRGAPGRRRRRRRTTRPLTSPNASTPSSASRRRAGRRRRWPPRRARVHGRARGHLMDDVDHLRASNLGPAPRRECEERAPRPRGRLAPAARGAWRLGAGAAARGAERADAARRTSALESDPPPRAPPDVLAAERRRARRRRRWSASTTPAAVVSPSLRRPKLVASATDLLDLPSARRPRLADSASVAPSADDRAVEVALLRANLQARGSGPSRRRGPRRGGPAAASSTTCDSPAAAGRTR